MGTEERTQALEEDLMKTKEELQQILLDIRTFQMEAQTPLRAETKKGKIPTRRNKGGRS